MSISTSWVLKPFITKYFLLQADDAVQGDGNQQGFQFDPAASLPNEFRFWCVATATQHTTLTTATPQDKMDTNADIHVTHTHWSYNTQTISTFFELRFADLFCHFYPWHTLCVDNMNCVVVFKFPVKVKNHFVWI